MSIQEGEASVEMTEEVITVDKIQVPVVKAKTTIEVDLSKLPDEMYKRALAEGLKVMLNGGMTKITGKEIPDEEKRQEAAMEVAEARLEQIYNNELRSGRGATAGKSKESGEVMVEARAIAKKLVKEAIKRQGQRIGAYTGKEITAYANEYLAQPESAADIIKQAKEAIALRNKAKPIDLTGKLKSGPDVARKPRKAPLSAKQAAQTTVRQRPELPRR